MKKLILFLFLFFIFFNNAQIRFEKGYIITNDDKKEEVFIKNPDRSDSPKNFIYRISEKSSDLLGTPDKIKEYGIYDFGSYISYTGPVDKSSDDISALSYKYEPEFRNETVFLKVLVSGDKNLYSYSEKNTTKYFYSDSESTVQPLIFKKYNPQGDQFKVAKNNSYIKQLQSIFNEDTAATKLIPETKYTENNLKKIFRTHNQQLSTNSENENQSKKYTAKYNLNVRPGINFYSPLKTKRVVGSAEFPSRANFRLGLEAEFILPINKNKWSILLEPTYSIYSNEKLSIPSENNLYNISLESYSYINIPVGIRYYLFLNNHSKFFINTSVNVINIRTGKAKSLDMNYNDQTFDKAELKSILASKSFSFGVGYIYKNKFSVEARYNSQYNILAFTPSSPSEANLSYTSLILGYNIF
ncbi:hypothetical protein [Chryseobacterium sp.]|uniref:hypothetical protein n=1 Tax=Chryseobacterium sp. TaxID=1871047 RepID=UPI00289E714F|nr:hypothetical protein [Chryseobacterium sp.]